jgi:putative inorganic carbon (HCO3(-)) transporter
MFNLMTPLPYLLLYFFFFFIRPHEYPGWNYQTNFMPIFLVLGLLFSLIPLKKEGDLSFGMVSIALLSAVFMSFAHIGWVSGAIAAATKFLPTVLAGFVVSRAVRNFNDFKVLAMFVALVGGFLGVYAIDQVANGIGWAGTELKGGRVYYLGLLSDPNDMANVMLMALPLSLFLLRLDGGSIILKLTGLACFVFILIGVALTQSRGAVVAIAIMLILFFAIQRRNWRVLLLIPPLFFAFQLIVPERFSGEDATAEASSAGRINAWSVGINLLKSSPLFGVGFGNFTDYYRLTAHNSFVLAFSELGLFGYIIWFYMIFASFYICWMMRSSDIPGETRSKERVADYSRVQFAFNTLFYSMVGISVTSFFLSRTYMPALYLLVGMIFGLYTMSVNVFGINERLVGRTMFIRSTICSLAFVGLIYIVVRVGTYRFA